MAQVLHDGTIRHEDNCLSDLGNTTPASVASRLTDEQIESIAESLEHDAENLYGDNTRLFMDDENNAAAVLRDYVRMRKLKNAIYERIKEYRDKHQDEVIVFRDIKSLLAEAEKGAME